MHRTVKPSKKGNHMAKKKWRLFLDTAQFLRGGGLLPPALCRRCPPLLPWGGRQPVCRDFKLSGNYGEHGVPSGCQEYHKIHFVLHPGISPACPGVRGGALPEQIWRRYKKRISYAYGAPGGFRGAGVAASVPFPGPFERLAGKYGLGRAGLDEWQKRLLDPGH